MPMSGGVARRRPLVFINSAMSVDGKISSTERALLRISDDDDMERVDRLRAEVDAIVVGGGTLRTDDPRLTIRSEALRRLRVEKGLGPDPLKVVVTGSGNVPLDSAFLAEGNGLKIVFTTRAADPARLECLSRAAEVHVIGDRRVDFRRMMDALAERGVGVVMVEGGAMLNFEMIRARIVDEIHVTISPVIIGGEAAPTLVDGKGFTGEGIQDLELISCERSGTSVLVKYRLKYDDPVPGVIEAAAPAAEREAG